MWTPVNFPMQLHQIKRFDCMCMRVFAELVITFLTDVFSNLHRWFLCRRPGRAAMSLVLRNLQRAVPLRRAPLRRQVQALRGILGVREFDLGIICVDNKRMQRINRTYRGKDVPTDVLSFPFHENLEAGEIPQPDFADDYNLGDIFLGVEYIFQHCKENEDYYDILTVTATHGLCHLLGFTHSTEAAWQKMYQKEKQVLEELGRHTGARLQPLSRASSEGHGPGHRDAVWGRCPPN